MLKGTGASTYIWSNGENKPVIILFPTTNIIYTLTGTNTDGCIGTQTVEVTLGPCSSINEIKNSGISLYPIPAISVLTIKVDKPME